MNLSFLTGNFWQDGMERGMSLLLLRREGVERTDTTRRAAIASFGTYLLIVPWWFFSTLNENRPYFKHYGVDPSLYLGAQFLGSIVTLLAGLWLLWLFAKSEDVTPGYWRYINASNWLQLVQVLLFAIPMFFIVRYRLLSHHEIQALSTGLYVITLVSQWFTAWRTFRCNPFVAAGFSILMPMVGTVGSDLINLRFFGTARPFESDWFITLYNAGGAYLN